MPPLVATGSSNPTRYSFLKPSPGFRVSVLGFSGFGVLKTYYRSRTGFSESIYIYIWEASCNSHGPYVYYIPFGSCFFLFVNFKPKGILKMLFLSCIKVLRGV